MHRAMWSLALLAGLALLLHPLDADGRRRKKKKKTGSLKGRLKVDSTFSQLAPPASKAYWRFGTPELREKRWRPDYRHFLIFVSAWNERGNAPTTEINIRGALMEPPLLVIPRLAENLKLTLHNRDRLIHRIRSAKLGQHELHPNSKREIPVRGIPPCQGGDYSKYQLRSADLPALRGEIMFLCSSHFTFADRSGRFRLKKIPRGEHKLRVYYRGRVVLERKVKIGKRQLKLRTLKLTLKR